MTDHDKVLAIDHPSNPERWARLIDVPKTTAAHQASLDTWLIHAPGDHPRACSFWLGVVHLRPIAGAPSPKLAYPQATYELIMMPLVGHANPDDPKQHWMNDMAGAIVVQFHGPDDQGSNLLVSLLARSVVEGRMPLYPPDRSTLWHWWQSMQMTLEHLMTGGHGPTAETIRQN